MRLCTVESISHILSSDLYINQFFDYAMRYIELSSMVYDLYPFIPMLVKENRIKILEKLRERVENITDDKRKARATITLYKIRKIFGLYSSDVKTSVKELSEAYFRLKDLDAKPEKGERKIADDLVLILNELLD